jgi:sugar O-acyltransferase (sialic acid O-acetyltransferase NeuD family)
MNANNKPKIVLIGGGGHCAACIDVIELENKFEIAGIVDNRPTVGSVCGYTVLGDDSILPTLVESIDYALVTVGQIESVSTRKKLIELVTSLKFQQPTIISPRAYVSQYASVGAGCVVMHDALVNARATIGQHCIINSKALIEHDAVIEHYCHISTGAIINGGALIRQDSFVGSHATVIENGVGMKGQFIKAGTVFKGEKNG